MDDLLAALDAADRRVKVLLTQPETVKAINLVKGRNAKESKFGAMTYDGRLSGSKAHLVGMFGEMAVAKYLKGGVDERIFEDHGDDGTDFILDGVGELGIKCTSYLSDPFLRVELEHYKPTLAGYVLCAMDTKKPWQVFIIGWATPAMVEAAPQQQFVPNGPMNYVLLEHELLDVATLLKP